METASGLFLSDLEIVEVCGIKESSFNLSNLKNLNLKPSYSRKVFVIARQQRQ